MAKKLSEYFRQAHTEEEARAYLNVLQRPYKFGDLYKIALRQIASEDAYVNSNNNILFCDTDLITIKIWSQVKYGKVDKRILRLIDKRQYDLYLLCYPDIPWEPDPLRENPHNRPELFQLYKEELLNYGKSFCLIAGSDYQKRMDTAVHAVEHLL